MGSAARRRGGAGAGAGASTPVPTDWEHPGWGSSKTVTVVKSPGGLVSLDEARDPAVLQALAAKKRHPHPALGEFMATSIAGNDLLSSVLYTAGICVQFSGKLAPVALLLVSFMLYFFRFVYAEVVTAMPVNGGSYNALLNTTSKRVAAIASCLSMLSYVATAVVSAYSAVAYIQPLWPWAATQSGTTIGTVSLLAVFAALTIVGIGESAFVALGMFGLHVTALTVVCIFSLVYAVHDHWTIFRANWATPFPDVLTGSGELVAKGTAGTALFYGYAAALLGITGFETAANYVEEMAGAHVYVATLRNMWLAAGFFNPLVALLAMGVLPMSEMYANSSNLLAALAERAGGKALQTFLCIDGFIVLAGSVLTAYVGITGLVRRLALDRCLPGFLGTVNSLRGTNHWIILSFFGLTSSLYLLLAGVSGGNNPGEQMDNLSGVYDMAFLSVMTAFALSAIILKWKRPDLPRLVISSWPTVFIALAFVLAGLVGNIIKGPEVLQWFFLYFGAVLLVVLIMFERTRLLKAVLYVTRRLLANARARARGRARKRSLQDAHRRMEAERRTRRASSDGGAVRLDVELLGDDGKQLQQQKQAPHKVEDDEDVDGGDDNGAEPRGFVGRILTRLFGGAAAAAGGDDSDEAISGGADYRPLAESLLGGEGGGEEGGPDAAPVAHAPLPHEDSEAALWAVQEAVSSDWRSRVIRGITERIRAINAQPIAYFAKDGRDLTTLNKAILYVRDNEQTHRLVVVHVVDDRAPLAELLAARAAGGGSLEGVPRTRAGGGPDAIVRQVSSPALVGAGVAAVSPSSSGGGGDAAALDADAAAELLARLPPPGDDVRLLVDNVSLLDAMYPKLRVDALVVRGSYFCPAVVGWLARHLGIAPNMMFMAMPDERFPHQFASLGGVRVITRSGSAAARHAQEAHLREVLRRVAGDMVTLLADGTSAGAAGSDGSAGGVVVGAAPSIDR